MMVFTADSLLTPKYDRWKTILILLLSVIGYRAGALILPQFSYWRMLFGFLYFLCMISYFHQDQFNYKLFIVTFIFAAIMVSELIFGALIPRDMILSGELFEKYPLSVYAVYLFTNGCFLFWIYLSFRFKLRKYVYHGVSIPWYLFILFPLSQITLMAGWFESYPYSQESLNPWKVLPAILISAAADLGLLAALRLVIKATEVHAQNEMLNELIRAQESYYDKLTGSYENMRRLRHDIGNHLYTIRALIQDSRISEAEEYAAKFSTENQEPVLLNCENTVVASYLFHKKKEFENKGIALELDIHIPKHLEVANTDLICTFGNLLDNAEEAVKEKEKPAIQLQAYFKKPYLTIMAKKPKEELPKKKQERIPGLERGLGQVILNNLTQKYDGQFRVYEEEQLYCAELILKEQED